VTPALLAISDLHINHPENRRFLERLVPSSDGDQLIVAGDVCETADAVIETLRTLRERFDRVIWCPGNHELWTSPHDECRLGGVARYEHLVRSLREVGVVTPEDDYPVFESAEGPVRIASMMTLYDHSFRPRDGAEELPLTDVALLQCDPYPDIGRWCRDRVEDTYQRLRTQSDPDVPYILVNHYPLVQRPVDSVYFQGIAPWCGTSLTASWHREFPVRSMVYGHLHIRRRSYIDGVRFDEVSVGYPREWKQRPDSPGPVTILTGRT